MAKASTPPPSMSKAAELYKRGQITDAEVMANALVRANPRMCEAWELLAAIATKRAFHQQAAAHLRRCIEIRPNEARLHAVLGKCLHTQGRSDEALAACDAALAIQPNYPDVTLLKAIVLERRGDAQQALDILAETITNGPEAQIRDCASVACRAYMALKQYDEAISLAERFARDPATSVDDRTLLLFNLAKAYDKTLQFEKAIASAAEAHALGSKPFDAIDYSRMINLLRRIYAPKNLPRLKRATNRSELPVFIAGMPRSGTTLVEQIIDAHPLAHGAGELSHIIVMSESLTSETNSFFTYPECVADLTTEVADRLANQHIEYLQGQNPASTRTVDKALRLYEHVGLIWQLFPGARVIHCIRDPLDTCLSCYTGHLSPIRHAYAASMDHLAQVYVHHERIMEHWKATLDIPILTIQYEEMVANQEAQTRRLIEFLGLPWDDRCLRYYESGRTVMTLSYDQVNKPIYDSSIGRHKRYGALLDPLREALERHRGTPVA